MGRARERGEVRDRAASERVARRRDPARREKRGREPRENARASSDEEDWSEEEARDRRRRDARGARRGASSSSRDARPREGAARARRRVVAASPSASEVSSDEASRRESASERSDDDASSGESDAERDEPEQPRGLGRLWRVAGRGVIGGVLAARSALASTSVRREARSSSRADANSDASSSDVFETESESEHESEHEPLDTRVRHVAVKRLKTRASESETSSDSDWDVETARALRGDASERRRVSAPRTNAQFTSRKKRKKQMDAARLQAALVRERLDAADERRTREKETSSKTRAEKTVTFATSAAPETAPLLSSAAFEQRATTKRLIKRATSVGTASGASLTKLVLLSAVALLGVVMLSAGASSVLAATLSENGPSEKRSATSSTRPFFAAERRETRRDEAPSTSFSTSTVTADENTVVPARDAGVRALDVSPRGLDDARVADAEADAMVRAATAAAAEAKAKTSSEEVASEPEMASPEVASPEPEVASPAFVESASDDDDESERRPHVTDDMTYEEKQAEFARFAAAEAARNDRIAAEAAERERANAAGEQPAETEEVVNVVEAEGRPPETETEASETTVAEPAEEEPGPDETDSSSWPLVGAGQRLIVNVPDDVTQDATAEIETGAMTPDEEVRRSASVAGLGSDSR